MSVTISDPRAGSRTSRNTGPAPTAHTAHTVRSAGTAGTAGTDAVDLPAPVSAEHVAPLELVAFDELVASPELLTTTGRPSRSRTWGGARRHTRNDTWGVVLLADLLAFAVTAATAGPAIAAVLCGVALLGWLTAGLYSRRFTLSLLDDVPTLSLGVLGGTAVTALAGWEAADAARAAAVLLAGVLATRSLGYAAVRRRRLARRDGFAAVVLGSGPVAATLVDRVVAHPETGLRLVGFLDRHPGDSSTIPFLGTPADLGRVLSEHLAEDLIVCDAALSSTELVDVLRACSRLPVHIHVVPPFPQAHRPLSVTDQVWGVPLQRLRRHPTHTLAWRVKRLVDVLVSGVALVLLTPVLAAVAAAVRRELGPGVIFRQERVSLDGRRFELLKFRSMPHPGPGRQHPWSVRDDNLLGPVGRFIRTYSLDELPQLFNVLVGDMSLVGPRPERPLFVERFSREVTGYGHRHRVPAGVTGLAAVEGLRGDTSLSDRAYFDNWYIENWSLWLDVKVLARTVLAVFRGTGDQ